jgi:hypothetical protein
MCGPLTPVYRVTDIAHLRSSKVRHQGRADCPHFFAVDLALRHRLGQATPPQLNGTALMYRLAEEIASREARQLPASFAPISKVIRRQAPQDGGKPMYWVTWKCGINPATGKSFADSLVEFDRVPWPLIAAHRGWASDEQYRDDEEDVPVTTKSAGRPPRRRSAPGGTRRRVKSKTGSNFMFDSL